MRYALLVAAALVALVGCSDSTVGGSSVAVSTSTAATTTTVRKVSDVWLPRLDGTAASSRACSPTLASTQPCAEYLTKLVEVVDELKSELTKRPDRFRQTINRIDSIVASGEAYGQRGCRLHPVKDSSGDNLCFGYVIDIVGGVALVKTQLQVDDMAE